jgi:HK97 family phage prohead protease
MEFRAQDRADTTPTLSGHPAVYDMLSEDLGGYREKIAPGAFDQTLADNNDVYALWNHNPDFVIAAQQDGSLRLATDERGLRSEIDPMNTQTINDLVVTPIRQGKINKMSFAFEVQTADWETLNGVEIRVIRQVRLFDVSPVTYPAYSQTDISARTLEHLIAGASRELQLTKEQREALRASVSLLTSKTPVVAAQKSAAPDAARSSAADAAVEIWRRRVALWERVAATPAYPTKGN